MSSGFDIASYQIELAQASFDAARSRLESRGWTLEPGPPDHVRARKVFGNGPYEIVLPLDRVEQAAFEYDEAQRLRTEIAASEVREAKRIAIQAELDAELKRKLRAAETKLRDEQAIRDHP